MQRVVHLGFEVRVELTLADDQHLWAQMTRAQAEELELDAGSIVYVRPNRRKTFRDGAPHTEQITTV